MKILSQLPDAVPEFHSLLTAIDSGGCPAVVTGLSLIHRANFAAALRRETGRPVVLVCADATEARRMAADMEAMSGEKAALLTAREFSFYENAAASRQWEHGRLAVLETMLSGTAGLVAATVEALLQRTIPKEQLAGVRFTLDSAGSYDLIELSERLAAAGYTRCQQVEGVGQFSLRGGILDFFSPAHPQPVRVEFWGDAVDSMGLFDVSTQRRTKSLDRAVILPAGEVLPALSPEPDCPGGDRYLPRIYPTLATAVDYLPPDALVLFSESPRVAERAKNYLWQLGEDTKALAERQLIQEPGAVFARTFEQLLDVLMDWPLCCLDSFSSSGCPLRLRHSWNVQARQLPSFGASLETAMEDLTRYAAAKVPVVLLVGSEQRALKLQSLLRERKCSAAVDFQLHKLPQPGRAVIAVGGLSAGMQYGGTGLAVLSEGQAPPAKKRRKGGEASNRQRLQSYADLAPGDLVVHEHHGIGRFVGMVKLPVDGVEKDYVQLAYAGSDTLYVPATQLDLVSKYIGSGDGEGERKLSRLGGTEWAKTRTRAKKAVAELARGLIQLYAQRQRQPGYAFSPDSPWMREFEEEFEYPETEDQLRCIAEIKRDMEQPRPMDRLLCGDVGFGKTEVAFRAIMKCILEGKQAAILVPTTVLARQHYLTAQRRWAKFPVEIEMISRFRTAAQTKDILRRLEEGKVDLLIGTHRLLQKDVKFHDLGLLVVDEEQRFGVTHKERLKEMSKQVDVLTLSATPIPRTLNMAMSGLRDMSVLEEPPQGRQPVQTYVVEHDWSLLADAMRRELDRGGQIYYLHNRLESIQQTAGHIRRLLGEGPRIGIAHGQMSQQELDDVMTRMTDNELDILVCTTIIETGIDLGNVNTLIIENADKMGLAQLHQIRGRVGRSGRRAYAYMTYRRGKVLSEVASKRLSAIREFAEFGSGFKIAMRDLEIRGAGNLLGPEQSGFLVSVGYDLYLKLLEEAVLEERGELPAEGGECAADLAVAAGIPDQYVPSQEQRMDLYRRIAHLRTEEEADDMVDELVDRFGDPPRPVNQLIAVALLRGRAAEQGVREITQKGNEITLALTGLDLPRLSRLCALPRWKGRLLLLPGAKPALSLKLAKGEDPLRLCQRLVDDFSAPESPEQG
ncbi:MAG: transcription-repair coupling factor [Oscillospiraceae bacterium]|nr:transcription-repair coupling factor [Oscillospiraceae bacterium]